MTEGVITACAPRRKRKRRAAVSASTQGNTVVTMQLELVSQPAANDPMDQLPFAQSYNRLYMGARREVASQRNLDYINPGRTVADVRA